MTDPIIPDTEIIERVMGAGWRRAEDAEIPMSFRDPLLKDFRSICSNGFVGALSLESVFRHKPSRWPQCFPNGAAGNASCTCLIVRRAA